MSSAVCWGKRSPRKRPGRWSTPGSRMASTPGGTGMDESTTFGVRLEGVTYVDRPAAYAVIAGQNGTVAAVKGKSGKFGLAGDDCLPGDDAEETVWREVRNELARRVLLIRSIGVAN